MQTNLPKLANVDQLPGFRWTGDNIGIFTSTGNFTIVSTAAVKRDAAIRDIRARYYRERCRADQAQFDEEAAAWAAYHAEVDRGLFQRSEAA